MRIIIFRVLQVIWILASCASLGVGVWGVALMRKNADDLVGMARGKKILMIGGIAFGVSVLITVILFIVSARMAGPAQETQQRLGSVPLVDEASFGVPSGQYSKVASHYPTRNEKNIPRNTSILITFTEPIAVESVMGDGGALREESVRITQGSLGKTGGKAVAAIVELDGTATMLTITPRVPLGEANKVFPYIVTLTERILKERTRKPLFDRGSGYAWQFEVTGFIDASPPQVDGVLPLFSQPKSEQSAWPVNTLIQMTFTESIDPSALSGAKIEVMDLLKNKPIAGVFSLGNDYKTLSFVSLESCAKNACQEAVFCLPKSTKIRVTIKAAALSKQPKSDMPYKAQFPYTGIVDNAGNSLDGGGENGSLKNKKADGPGQDDFVWTFSTSDELKSDPPAILSTAPLRDALGVTPETPIDVAFSTFMDLTSLHLGSVALSDEINAWLSVKNDLFAKQTLLRVLHDPFKKETSYTPEVRSDVKDIYQNCFLPCSGPGK